jgi:hypothetical protein
MGLCSVGEEEELDIQGAFATELLERLNIHSPKKSSPGSSTAFRE